MYLQELILDWRGGAEVRCKIREGKGKGEVVVVAVSNVL